MPKKFIIFFLFFALIVFSATSHAATVYLKTGQKIEGKIIEDTDGIIKIVTNGIPAVYYPDQIQKVVRDVPKPKPAGPVVILKAKKEKILKLLEVNGVRKNLEQTFTQTVAQVPIENQKELNQLLNVQELLTVIAGTYDKYYSDEDLDNLIKFYESPTGKKLLSNTPQVMKDTMDATLKHLQAKIPSLGQ